MANEDQAEEAIIYKNENQVAEKESGDSGDAVSTMQQMAKDQMKQIDESLKLKEKENL